MRLLCDGLGVELRWVQPTHSRARFVLQRGSVELAALERDQQKPALVRATVGADSWRFVGQQLFDPAVKIYSGAPGVVVAAAQPLAWLDSESRLPELRLHFATGQCYAWLWQRNASLASCTCRTTSAGGQEILRIQMRASQSTTARLKHCRLLLLPAAGDLADLPLLTVLSPYLLLLGQELSGPLPRRRSLLGEDVAASLLEVLVAFLSELLGHLHG